jgi:hypothetical protein
MVMRRRPPAGNVRRVEPHGDAIRYTVVSKAGDTVQCESHGERAWLLNKDRMPTVLRYRSQPITFTWRDEGGKEHTYVPDFMVWTRDGPIEIHEITRAFRRSRPESARREEEGRRTCRERGWRFFVHDEGALPGQTELANLLALIRFRPRIYADPAVALLAALRLRDGERQGLRALAEDVAGVLGVPPARAFGALHHELWHGTLATDMETVLIFDDGRPSPEARAWLPIAAATTIEEVLS